MSIVRVKNKYQVVIPENIRDQIGVEVGDLFEVKAERGKITLTPKSLVDRIREIAPVPKELRDMQETAKRTGANKLTMKDINDEIAAYRREKQQAKRSRP
jgi:AbrB family looped-hinge helix DNA binding protein